MNDISGWLKERFGAPSQRAAAERVGVDYQKLGRWIGDPTKAAHAVIVLARGYGQNPVLALIEENHISPDEVNEAATEAALRSATDKQLALEILRRTGGADTHPELEEPIDRVRGEVIDEPRQEGDEY